MPKRDVPDAKRRAGSQDMPSIISAALHLTGNVECDGVVHVDGTIDGDVRCESLTVGETGSVDGHICASEVEVRGTVKGSVQAKRVLVKASARIAGDVTHEMLVVERGAAVSGFYRTAKNVGVTGRVDIRNSIGSGLRNMSPPLSRRLPSGPGRQRGETPVAPPGKAAVADSKSAG
jgi:cytoskeletal protein CcmA (bactofilin family)